VSDTVVSPQAQGESVPGESPVLECKGLDVGYGKLTVARDITFTLQQGKVLTVLGPNGAGKTTLLMTLAGFLPPRAGTIALKGVPVKGSSPRRMNQAGMILIPDFRALFTELTPIQNLKLAAPRGADLGSVLELFPALARREKLRTGDLSGGEQQMFAEAAVDRRDVDGARTGGRRVPDAGDSPGRRPTGGRGDHGRAARATGTRGRRRGDGAGARQHRPVRPR
jgi:ABC-type transport system involved in cytochrome bd biosynthesis fused ATPase/permease subunit